MTSIDVLFITFSGRRCAASDYQSRFGRRLPTVNVGFVAGEAGAVAMAAPGPAELGLSLAEGAEDAPESN
jgi:hypothetical protein